MAGTLTNNGKNVMLTALGGVAAYASLHTADPGATGVNEVTGGSPAYARKALSWDTAASGSIPLKATFPVFDVPAATTVAYVGLWSLASGGTFYGSWDVTDEVFAAQGNYTLSSGSVAL